MHRFGFLLYWSTVNYISKKNIFKEKIIFKEKPGLKREKDEGILTDGQKKRKSTKKDRDSLKKQKKYTWYVCKYSKMLLGVRYNERENNKIVTLGPNKVSVSPK